MADNELDIFDKLTHDADALREFIATYARYLRMVVHRKFPSRLRAKFDSEDVVQAAWLDLMEGIGRGDWRFTDVGQFRAFLARVVYNRLIDHIRKHQKAQLLERALDEPQLLLRSRQPRPSECAVAEDLWEKIQHGCSPAQQQVLRLKREGCSLDEIAVRTGLHKSSVRRILYDRALQVVAESHDH